MRYPLLLPLLVPGLVCAQSLAPVISFRETSFSFGKIAADQQVTHSFQLTNTGQAQLNIKEVRASCGCTSAVTGKWSLAPGEGTAIEATFNSANFNGVVRKSITVTSDDPVNPIVNLHFDAEVVSKHEPSTRFVSLQNVDRRSVHKSILRLEFDAINPVRVKEIRTSAPYLRGIARGEGSSGFLEILVDGRLIPKGKTGATDTLSIHSMEEGTSPIEIQIQWELQEVIAATPSFVAWAGKPGEKLQATIQLQHIQGRAFRILEAKASHPLIQVDALKTKASVRHELRIRMSPEAKACVFTREKVILLLDDPDQSELSIRVSAVIR